MTDNETKNALRALWKDTFHDTEDYVDLIFNRVYDPRYSIVHRHGGKIVAGLLGVPYRFRFHSFELRAIYLCGLATRPEMRRRGIMAGLMERIIEITRKEGFHLAFLIPADQGLIQYYHDHGWNQAIYRVTEHYLPGHIFMNETSSDKSSVIRSEMRIEYLRASAQSDTNIKFSDLVIDYMKRVESSKEWIGLCHNDEMLCTVIYENQISAGDICMIFDKSGTPHGVAFIVTETHDKSDIDIRFISADNSDYINCMLQSIASRYPDRIITVRRFADETFQSSVYEPFYIGADTDNPILREIDHTESGYRLSAHSDTYGMAKILDRKRIIETIHALNINRRSPVWNRCQNTDKISDIDLQGIIFRHPDSDKEIGEAFYMDRLPLNAALLLD